jgi:SAM-dependent methyltransferase
MYGALADMVPETIAGAVVEIGAGSGIGKNWIPDLTCTDVIPASTLDAVVDACHLPYTDDSIRAFVLKDALHHIPDVTAFLDEAYRCLKPGGAVVMCEPFWGPFASLIYRTIHPEPFNKRQKDWGFSSSDAWDSNQALPWMLLRRDIDRLQTLWPNFALEERGPLLGPSYALSGGVFGRTPIPSSWLVALWRNEQRIGRILDPFRLEYAFRLVKGIDQLGIKGDS